MNNHFSRSTLLLYFFLFAASLFAQYELAIVQDSDGFSNIRTEASLHSEIAQKIETGALLDVKKVNDNWYACSLDDTPLGFIHSSRIRLFTELPDSEKRQKLRSIFEKEIELTKSYYEQFYKGIKDDNSAMAASNHHINYFITVTKEATRYVCSNNDMALLLLYQKARWEARGSASEQMHDNFDDLVFCLSKDMIDVFQENCSNGIQAYFKTNFQYHLSENGAYTNIDKDELNKILDAWEIGEY